MENTVEPVADAQVGGNAERVHGALSISAVA